MAVRAASLTTDTRTTPLGIDSAEPELAWKIVTEVDAVVQRGFEIQVSTCEETDEGIVWASGRVDSAEPFGVRYAGPPLESARRYWWRVRVWCTVGEEAGEPPSGEEVESGWSDPTWFETAMLDPRRWRASWISGAAPTSKRDDPVLYLRSVVDLGADVVRARAYVSALGWYRFFVNGHDLTGPALVPRWTPFDEVVEHQTYDVTEPLRRGANVVAIAVGDGRYRGSLGLNGSRAVYGDRIGAYAQIEVELADGSVVTATTDGSWVAGPGRITGSDPKDGERADLRIPDADWLTDATAPLRFVPAELLPEQDHRLIAEEVGPVRAIDHLRPTVGRAPSGAQLLDFGQNFAGVVRILLDGPAGRVVTLTHGELLTPEGELDTESVMFTPKRPWYQREVVTLNGEATWYEPWFTIHGFRHVEVTGLDHEIAPFDVEGVVLSSDLAVAGSFDCSDPRLNQLHRNVGWSVRSNFTDTPTDCPARERSGWTGDIQVFAPTATTLVDAQSFLRRYLRNLALEQYEDGAVPIFIPSEQHSAARGVARRLMHVMANAAGWGDAAVLVPWALYQHYGDRLVLERQYESMRRWVDGRVRRARRSGRGRPLRTLVDPAARRAERSVVDGDFQFGEWLRPGEAPPALMLRGMLRPSAVVATAYLAQSSSVLARVAEVLGYRHDVERYAAIAADTRAAWRTVFVGADGRIGDDRQDDYVRALAFDLLLPDDRAAAVDRLCELIAAADDHLGTGFLSTPMLLGVLADGGRADVAMRLLLQTTNPSWLHQVEQGATTVWETWEGYDEDGRGKASHNHYALGAVAGWLTAGLAGLSPAAPGYRHIRIAPVVTEHLTHVAASVETPFGPASSAWRRTDDEITLTVVVPAGATAEVHVPDGAVALDPALMLASGSHALSWPVADR